MKINKINNILINFKIKISKNDINIFKKIVWLDYIIVKILLKKIIIYKSLVFQIKAL